MVNESCVASVIATLMLTLGVNGPLFCDVSVAYHTFLSATNTYGRSACHLQKTIV